MDLTAWMLLWGGVALGLGIALAGAATGVVFVGLAVRTWALSRPPTYRPAPPLILLGGRTLLPADGFERPALAVAVAPLPYAPGAGERPRHVIPGRVDPSAPTDVADLEPPPDDDTAESVLLEGATWIPLAMGRASAVGTGLEYRGRPLSRAGA